MWYAYRQAGYVTGSAYNFCEAWGAEYNDVANRHDHELIVRCRERKRACCARECTCVTELLGVYCRVPPVSLMHCVVCQGGEGVCTKYKKEVSNPHVVH